MHTTIVDRPWLGEIVALLLQPRFVRGWIEYFVGLLKQYRKPLLAIVGLTVVFTGLVLFQNRNFRPARTIDDPKFVSAANAICEKSIPQLRATRREDDTNDDLEVETADQIDKVIPRLEKVVVELRALDVRSADKAKVDEWFAAFDRYIAAGKEYSAALRSRDDDRYDKADDAGIKPLSDISNFARANHLDDCIP